VREYKSRTSNNSIKYIIIIVIISIFISCIGHPKTNFENPEVVEELLIKCNDLSKSIFIYGSKQEVINKFATNIKNKYPNIKVVGLRNGYTTNKSKVIEKIKNSDTDIILVGLGIPNQELFINEIYQEYSKGIFIGVGGSLDVLSGYKKRAPKIFVKLNLEWLYRIIKEPSRIKRFYKNNILFFIKIIKLKFSR